MAWTGRGGAGSTGGGRRRLIAAAAAAIGCAVSPASAQSPDAAGPVAQAAAAAHFDIPAQPLSSALLLFRQQAGLQVAYRTDDVRGVHSAGVSGDLAADVALRRLLEGSGLAFEYAADRTVTIFRPNARSGAVTLSPIAVEGSAPLPATAAVGDPPPAYAGGQVARGARLGPLGNRDMMDTPFSTSSYTAATIENRHAVTAADVLEYDPAVRPSASKGGILDAFFIRGFPIGEGNFGEVAFNGVYGIAPNYRVFSDYADRIEVLKGPSALLYGMAPNSSVGGAINIVPKRATEQPVTDVTADYVQDSQAGGHVDIGRRFGDDQAWGIRLNGSYHDGDTPLDRQSRETFVGALGADYRGDGLRASVDLIHQVERLDAPVRPFMIAAGVDVPSAPNGARNVSPSWTWSEVADQAAQGQFEYDLGSRVTLFAGLGAGRTTVDRLSGQVPLIVNDAGDTVATPFYYKFEIDRVTYDAGVRGTAETFGIGHAVTLQASRYEDELSRGVNSSSQTLSANIYDPDDSAPVAIAEPADVVKLSSSGLTGFVLADTLSAFDERVQLTLGGRYQTIESENFSATTGATTSSYDDDAVTPVVGLVVKPWSNVSLYANYIEGLSRGDIAPSTASNAGEALAPYVAKQREVGVKVDLGKIAVTAAAFQIDKPFGQLENGTFSEGGEQRNRGLEFGAFGEVAEGVRLFAGLTLFDAELTKTNSAATVGNRPIGVPEVQANLSAEWDLPFVEGLTLGGSVIYTGAEYVDAANTQEIPSWVRFDAAARYRMVVEGTPVILRATVENLFDEGYWSGVAGSYGGLGLGAPRTLSLSVTAKF